jgi:type I restriction enzyme R subunit
MKRGEGKDYFTVYDFVKSHHHFNDPEWDGEPVEPAPTPPPGAEGERPVPAPGEGPPGERHRRQRAKVKLADGKQRMIQHMMATTFWHPDGTPMSVAQFMEALFGRLPEFFKDEDELRAL